MVARPHINHGHKDTQEEGTYISIDVKMMDMNCSEKLERNGKYILGWKLYVMNII